MIKERQLLRTLTKAVAALVCANFLAWGSAPALAQNAEFGDVPAEHWAAKAIRDLTEKYGVMEGYPDKTFRGTRNITRYEAAAAFYKIMLQMSQVEDLTKRIGKITLEDLKALKALQEEFKQEIDTLKKQNEEQSNKIKQLEDAITKIKEDIGSVRFGGNIFVGAEDVFEDNFRPGYTTSFALNMRIAANDKTTIRAALNSRFSSIQADNEKGQKGTKDQFSTQQKINVGFGEAWFDHREGGFLAPRIKFGFMGSTRLILPFTTIPNQFGNSIIGELDASAIDRASPNLFGAASHGIRYQKGFVAGAEFTEGFFGAAVAASQDIFYGQLNFNLGLVRLKFVSEGDQAIFIGEPVLDTLHNHTVLLDIGNDVFGVGMQGTFRGLADEFDFRAAAANTNLTLSGFSIGASGRFENEKTYQQVIAGMYVSSPSNLKQMNADWPDVNIPSLMFGIQSPFTLQNGELFEGSPDEVGDLAGFMVQLSYDNPIIPNLTLELGRRQKVFMNSLPTDSKFDKTTLAVSSSFFF
jgi:cell division protein FtsB